MQDETFLYNKIENLLKQVGNFTSAFSIVPFKRLGNNRTYIIESGGVKYFAKHFFQNKDDLRDRFSAELNFVKYAVIAAPGFTPRILAVDPVYKLILSEFIIGTPLIKNKIGENEVMQAAAFFRQLNNQELISLASDLQNASEACFSVSDHLALIQGRISHLESIFPESEQDRKALKTTANLRGVWNRLTEDIYAICHRERLNINEELPADARVISPSDFGFHNSLMKEDGKIIFLDFEYAGWDDPTKMLGDFFGQIQVPVPKEFFAHFMQLTFSDLPGSNSLKNRAEILRPLFQIKWACIALNVFLPIHLARRRFSDSEVNIKVLKEEQLVKAENILKYFKTNFNGIY